ncbi:hypothetical protein TgHK011_004661 [Trichoderma gracile]|nr:hypothetical protein TgHK011_004661 [Trichoderma gracile]
MEEDWFGKTDEDETYLCRSRRLHITYLTLGTRGYSIQATEWLQRIGKNSIAELFGGDSHGDQHVSSSYIEDEPKELAEPALAALH